MQELVRYILLSFHFEAIVGSKRNYIEAFTIAWVGMSEKRHSAGSVRIYSQILGGDLVDGLVRTFGRKFHCFVDADVKNLVLKKTVKLMGKSEMR